MVRAARALVVESSPAELYRLQRMLLALNIEVVLATSVADAINLCRDQPPDVVLHAVDLPDDDGLGLVRFIRENHPGALVPIFCLVDADSAEHEQVRCYEAGGYDTLTRPVTPAVLQAKLEVALRLRALHHRTVKQRDRLATYHTDVSRELGIANSILGRLASAEVLHGPNVRFSLRPVGTLSGDIVLGARSPSRSQAFLIGDFTGHGIAAAIAIMAVHGVFSAMVGKGIGIESIARELNRKVAELLPTGRFLSAALLEFWPETGVLAVWNGGMPELLLRGLGGEIKRTFASHSLPLGITEGADFAPLVELASLDPGEFVFACSDGLLEAVNGHGEMFGNQRLREVLEGHQLGGKEVLAAVDRHRGAVPFHDDVTVLEVHHTRELAAQRPVRVDYAMGRAATRWQLTLRLEADALRENDPAAVLSSAADALQGFGPRSSELFLVVNELYARALEQGLLGLPVTPGDDAGLLARYYEERARRLDELTEGWISLELQHRPSYQGGMLEITARHGCNCRATAEDECVADFPVTIAGLAVASSVCAGLEVIDGGRGARARYVWHTGLQSRLETPLARSA